MKGIRIADVFISARLPNWSIHIPCVLHWWKGKREIRRVCDHFNITIKRLIRTRIGFLELDGLELGSYRELTAMKSKNLPYKIKKINKINKIKI